MPPTVRKEKAPNGPKGSCKISFRQIGIECGNHESSKTTECPDDTAANRPQQGAEDGKIVRLGGVNFPHSVNGRYTGVSEKSQQTADRAQEEWRSWVTLAKRDTEQRAQQQSESKPRKRSNVHARLSLIEKQGFRNGGCYHLTTKLTCRGRIRGVVKSQKPGRRFRSGAVDWLGVDLSPPGYSVRALLARLSRQAPAQRNQSNQRDRQHGQRTRFGDNAEDHAARTGCPGRSGQHIEFPGAVLPEGLERQE